MNWHPAYPAIFYLVAFDWHYRWSVGSHIQKVRYEVMIQYNVYHLYQRHKLYLSVVIGILIRSIKASFVNKNIESSWLDCIFAIIYVNDDNSWCWESVSHIQTTSMQRINEDEYMWPKEKKNMNDKERKEMIEPRINDGGKRGSWPWTCVLTLFYPGRQNIS